MKPLPIQFKKNGWQFEQMNREGNLAIFRKWKKPQGITIESFEVVKISQNPAYSIAGKEIPAAEGYPCSEQWGTRGWSFQTYGHALSRFMGLNSRPSGTISDAG